LPRRRPQGYAITSIVWEITASEGVVERIVNNVKLPLPPKQNLNEVKLGELLRQLTNPATQGFQILQRYESAQDSRTYKGDQHLRAEIRVLSGGRLLGRVNGAMQIFDQRGQQVTPGVPPNMVTDRGRGRRRPGQPDSGK
jgi:hypothetical protein